MPNAIQLEVGGVAYPVKDAKARQDISTINGDLETVHQDISNLGSGLDSNTEWAKSIFADSKVEEIQVTPTIQNDYRYGYLNGEIVLVSAEGYKAYSFDVDNNGIDYYILGTSVGCNLTQRIFFIDSSDNIISFIQDYVQTYEPVTYFSVPAGTAKVCYTGLSSDNSYAIVKYARKNLETSNSLIKGVSVKKEKVTESASGTGFISGTVGGTISKGTQTIWHYNRYDNLPHYTCIDAELTKPANPGAAGYIIAVSRSGIILEIVGDASATGDITHIKYIVPYNAEHIYVQSYSDNPVVYKTTVDMSQGIGNIKKTIDASPVMFGALNMIARLGYRPSEQYTPPEQSIKSYELAYDLGYRIMLCDVRLTSDGKFVGLHDESINSVACNPNGSAISQTVNISDITLAQADEYDFGIKKNAAYAGTKIMRCEDLMRFCKNKNIPIHLELKVTLTESQCDGLVNLVRIYGLDNMVMFNTTSNYANLRYIASRLPNAIVGIVVSGLTSSEISRALAGFNGITNEKFIYVMTSGIETITKATAFELAQENISIAYTLISTAQEFNENYNSHLIYCKYIASYVNIYELVNNQI